MTQAFNLSQFANKVNTSGQADLTTAVTGTLPIANGGTGLTSTPANGAIDIGNGSGFTRTTITAGTGITVTNGAGSISIAASGGSGGLGGLTTFTANGTFTIPSGVTKVKVTVIGGGGSGIGYNANCCGVPVAGNTGGTSTVSSGTQTITTLTATGGSGGIISNVTYSGGTGTNGDLNMTGSRGFYVGASSGTPSIGGAAALYSAGGINMQGGGTYASITGAQAGQSYGGGGTGHAGGNMGGCGGGALIKFLTGLTAGNTLTVVVGAGGASTGNQNASGAGKAGIVIFEY